MIQSVRLVDTATRRDAEKVAAVFLRAGFAVNPQLARHRTQSEPHLGEAGPWVVTVTLAAPIAAFFAAIGTEAGKDAYAAIKSWFWGLINASRGYGEVELRDPDGSMLNVRPQALSDRAFAALLEIDWSTANGTTLIWDGSADRWRQSQEALEELVAQHFPPREDRPGDSV